MAYQNNQMSIRAVLLAAAFAAGNLANAWASEGAYKGKTVHIVFSNHVVRRPRIICLTCLALFHSHLTRPWRANACIAHCGFCMSQCMQRAHVQDIGFDGLGAHVLGSDDNVINEYFDVYFPRAVRL